MFECRSNQREALLQVIREGRAVSCSARKYEFLTVDQAMGFARFLQQGKSLEQACKIWRPKRITAIHGSASGEPSRPPQD
ncbi:hypothetical protein AW878_07315 [Bordetella pseudohinzii]|uniref:Uncharacterized protein n=2 Tax=Bordetella pseudohinzii TaxID=1331258 RepID=A0ABM6DHK1_9BORD|nr:hypothetical protein BBN53_16510 [Bordetella pseudohinzii]KMM24388.1 hypothetical protein L540_06200 [Bordetella pseudohinzii]KXA80412.1 hypothetical protein AW878_07315 [Bordetella pseudohinzii]KXA80792.1 hypothetical protein AW877_06060 [Bordetella pseudohinzii]